MIWVDNDGYETLPEQFRGILLTSIMKNTEDAVVTAVEDAADGTISDEPIIGTLENGGVDIAPFHDLDARVSDETKSELEALRERRRGRGAVGQDGPHHTLTRGLVVPGRRLHDFHNTSVPLMLPPVQIRVT